MLITTITKANGSPFETLVPSELFGQLEEPGLFALGAIDQEGTDEAVAGVLFFEVDSGSNGTEDLTAAVIKWIYVAAEFQNKGVGDALMTEFFRIMDESELEHALCDLPMSTEYNFLCAYLEAWGFAFTLVNVYEMTVALSRILENPLFHARRPSTGVLPLKDVPDYHFRSFMTDMKSVPDVPDFLTANSADYDAEVSCGFLSGKALLGVLLIQSNAAKELEIVFLRAVSNVKEVLGNLVLFAGAAAKEKYPPETPVKIVCRTDSAAGLLSKLFPNAQPQLVRRGYYDNVPEDVPEDAPENAPENVPEDAPENVPENFEEEV